MRGISANMLQVGGCWGGFGIVRLSRFAGGECSGSDRNNGFDTILQRFGKG